jgi:hypothetical protein
MGGEKRPGRGALPRFAMPRSGPVASTVVGAGVGNRHEYCVFTSEGPRGDRLGSPALKPLAAADLRYFHPDDFVLTFAADGSFTITVDADSSKNPDAPRGSLVVASDGTTTITPDR